MRIPWEDAKKIGFDLETMEVEKERLRLKRGRILKQHRDGYIDDEEFEEEMAVVELALRMLDTPEVNGMRLEDVIEAGERLPGMAALWSVGSVEERSEIVKEILESGGLHYDVETKEIAALTPRPAFLPVLRLLEGVIEYEEATGTLVTSRWRQRNRRAMTHRSHLALIPLEKLFAGQGDILIYMSKSKSEYELSDDPFEEALDNPTVISLSQRRPGPYEPQWKIPISEWPNVVRRVVENREPLRKVAEDYGVSYETIRRVVNAEIKRKKAIR